jgi:hypothetical protein
MLAADDQGAFGFDGRRPDATGGFRSAVSIEMIEALV